MQAPSARVVRPADHWVPKVAVALAVLGTATIGWLAFGGSDDVAPAASNGGGATSETTSSATATALEKQETVIETTIATTLPPDTTVPPETAVPPPASAPLSAAATPPVPATEVLSGPGAPQVMNDPLPSGPNYTDVSVAFATAQRVADLLAAGDWVSARAMLPNDSYDDASFEFIYGPIERMSLMLLDAVPDGSGFTLVLGAVTNETAQNRTSVRCLHWYADAVAVDLGEQVTLNEYPGLLFGPETLRNDPNEDAKLRQGCG